MYKDITFNLDKDLVFFDIEATGLHVINDRIIQIALIKFNHVDGSRKTLEHLINPGAVLISEEAEKVHGISSRDVANKPLFRQVAKEIKAFIGDADLAGYNSNRFDIPILLEELARAGEEMSMAGRRTIDVMRIFNKMEPRTLKAAYRYYCSEEMVNAHDALADVEATIDVLRGQLVMYKGIDFENEDETIVDPVRNDMQSLHEFTTDLRFLDATQRLKVGPDKTVVFNFGKYVGKPVGETLHNDKQYYHWMLNKDFSFQVKYIIQEELERYVEALKNR